MNGWMFNLLGMVIVFIVGLFFVQSGRIDNDHYGRDEGDFGLRGGESDYTTSDGGGDGGGD